MFRLQVEGVAGNDANIYAATLSLRDRRDLAPRRARVRRPRADRAGRTARITELRSVVPADAGG